MLPSDTSGRGGEQSDRSVSLVMPVWRPDAVWFERALRSALDDDAVTELVVVDDGNDPAVTVPVDDPRVVTVHAPHAGPYAARDVGLSVARGAFVRFVDGDDLTTPGSTTVLLARLGGRLDAIAYGQTLMADQDLRPTRRFSENREGDVVAACVLGDFSVFHVAMLFPRPVVDAAGPWDVGFEVSGDWDFVLRAVEHAPVVRVDEVVTTYRRSPTSVMSSARLDQGVAARERVIRRFRERHPHRRELADEAQARLLRDRTSALAWRGDRVAAVRSWWELARHDHVAAAAVATSLARARLGMQTVGRS